jgi:hypothetical protein
LHRISKTVGGNQCLTGTQILFPRSGIRAKSGLEALLFRPPLRPTSASGYVTAELAEANHYQDKEVLFFFFWEMIR